MVLWASLTALILLLPVSFLGHLRFNFDLKGYLSANESSYAGLDAFEKRFGTDYDYFAITIPWPDGPEKLARLKETDKFLKQIAEFPEVIRVQGLANLTLPVFIAGQWQKKSLLTSAKTEDQLHQWMFSGAPWLNGLVSQDRQHLALWITTTSGLSKKKSDILLTDIKNFIDNQNIKGIRIIGKIKAQEVYFNHLPQNMAWLLGGGFLLIFGLLWVAVSQLRLVLTWLIGMMLPSFTLLGIMGWNQTPLDALSMMIPLVLAVVGLTDLLHLHLAFQHSAGASSFERWKNSFKEAGVPALLTSFTTAIGFLSLQLIPVHAVAQFGLWTAFGIFLTGLWVLVVHLFACLWLNASFKSLPPLAFFTSRPTFRRLILTACLLLSTGFLFLKMDHYMMQELPDNHPTMQEFKWFEKDFGGIRPFEAVVHPFSWKNQNDMMRLDRTLAQLETHFETAPLQSVVSALKLLHMGLKGGHPRYYTLPAETSSWRVLIQTAEQLQFEKEVIQRGWLSADGHYRISSRIRDIGAVAYLEKWNAWQTSSPEISLQLTGSAHQMDQSLQEITKNLFLGLGLSTLTIGLIFGWMVRSARLTLIALGVNLFPLACIGGLMGWTNTPLQISNLLFFNILLGIAVDDSLHILWRAYGLLRKGAHPTEAIRFGLQSTKDALGWSTLVLVAGFLPLCFSTFSSPQNLGWSMCLGLIAALWADLNLLPWAADRFFPSNNASVASNFPDDAPANLP